MNGFKLYKSGLAGAALRSALIVTFVLTSIQSWSRISEEFSPVAFMQQQYEQRTEAQPYSPSYIEDPAYDPSQDPTPEEEPAQAPRRHRRHRHEAAGADCEQCRAHAKQSLLSGLRNDAEDLGQATVGAPDHIMARIAAAAQQGWGRAGRNLCYKGVKQILAHAGAARWGSLPGGWAIDAMRDLPRAGFRNTFPSNCKTAGTIRVYRGVTVNGDKAYARRYVAHYFGRGATAGDWAGHTEVVGGDGLYYYSRRGGSPRPLNEIMKGRRTLIGCFVK